MVKLVGLFSKFFNANMFVVRKAGLVDFNLFCNTNLVVT